VLIHGKKVKLERPIETVVNIRPNCLKVDKAIVTFKSNLNSPQDPLYTGCNRRKGPDFGRVFLMLNYTDITQNTYIQS
jgi:hypothetical protein